MSCSDIATLEKAIDTVDLTALDAKNSAKFDASLEQAAKSLKN